MAPRLLRWKRSLPRSGRGRTGRGALAAARPPALVRKARPDQAGSVHATGAPYWLNCPYCSNATCIWSEVSIDIRFW